MQVAVHGLFKFPSGDSVDVSQVCAIRRLVEASKSAQLVIKAYVFISLLYKPCGLPSKPNGSRKRIG